MKRSLRFLAILSALTTSAVAGLIVDQVPESLLTGSSQSNLVASPPPVEVRPTWKSAPTAGDRWAKFEADFAITNQSSSLVKGSLQNAKYQLDQTSFALQEFVNNIESALTFDYGVSDLAQLPAAFKSGPGRSGNIWLDTFNGMRLQSDIDLKLGDRQFVGVKLVLPLGN